jgi:hypothetical protein
MEREMFGDDGRASTEQQCSDVQCQREAERATCTISLEGEGKYSLVAGAHVHCIELSMDGIHLRRHAHTQTLSQRACHCYLGTGIDTIA